MFSNNSDRKPNTFEKIAIKLCVSRKKAKNMLFAEMYGASKKTINKILKDTDECK